MIGHLLKSTFEDFRRFADGKRPGIPKALQGRIKFQGLEISVETRRSCIRYWYDPHTGKWGISRMIVPYGYIRGTEGHDGEEVDCFVGPMNDAPFAYIVHQRKGPDFKRFDEDKVMLGFGSRSEARAIYLKHYDDPRFFGGMSVVPMEEFKAKVMSNGKALHKAKVVGHMRLLPSGGSTYIKEHRDSRPDRSPDQTIREFSLPKEVFETAGIPAVPIRLVRGRQIADHRGFGLEHIEAQHGHELRRAGYKSAEDFVAEVFGNVSQIYRVSDRRFAFVENDHGKQKVHIVEARKNMGEKFYTVITGYIADRAKFDDRRDKLVWSRLAKAVWGVRYLLLNR